MLTPTETFTPTTAKEKEWHARYLDAQRKIDQEKRQRLGGEPLDEESFLAEIQAM